MMLCGSLIDLICEFENANCPIVFNSEFWEIMISFKLIQSLKAKSFISVTCFGITIVSINVSENALFLIVSLQKIQLFEG